MSFTTLLDLARQGKINLGETANLQGSMAIGESFFIGGIQINPANPVSNYVLTYDATTNAYIGAPQAATEFGGTRIFYGMGVSGITNLSYEVFPGIYMINSQFYNFTGDSVTINSGDSTYNRYDVLYVSGGTDLVSQSTVYVLQGTNATNPVIPNVPDSSTDLAIAIIYVPANTTANSGSTTIYYPNLISSSQVLHKRGIFTTLDTYLDANYVYPEINSFTNTVNSIEMGQSISAITFNWSVNKNGYDFELPDSSTTYSNITFTTTLNVNLTGTTATTGTSYSLTFYDGSQYTTKQSTISYLNKYYIGNFSGTSISSSDILNLESQYLTDTSKYNLNFLSGNSNYMYFCFPQRLDPDNTLTNFFVNGMYTNDFQISTILHTNEYSFTEPYTVIRTTNIINSNYIGFEVR